MSEPLFRVCYHCGRPTPGAHDPACRDADSGVVEVAKVTPPAVAADLRAEVEGLSRRLGEVLSRAVDAEHILRRIRELHTDSPAGVCPSCGRISDQSEMDDGLVDYPCPTVQLVDSYRSATTDAPSPESPRGTN